MISLFKQLYLCYIKLLIGFLISAQKENDRKEKLSNNREQWGNPPRSQRHQKWICKRRRREWSKGGVWWLDLSVEDGWRFWWGHGKDEARQKIKTEREFTATARQSQPWRQQGASSIKYETKVDKKPLDFKTANRLFWHFYIKTICVHLHIFVLCDDFISITSHRRHQLVFEKFIGIWSIVKPYSKNVTHKIAVFLFWTATNKR